MALRNKVNSELVKAITDSVLKSIVPVFDKRFDQVDVRFDQIDKRFEQVDIRFDQIDKRFEQVDKRFEQIDIRFDKVDKRFEQVDIRFDQIDKRFEQVDKRFEQIDIRFDKVDKRFVKVDQRFDLQGADIVVQKNEVLAALDAIVLLLPQKEIVENLVVRVEKLEQNVSIINTVLKNNGRC